MYNIGLPTVCAPKKCCILSEMAAARVKTSVYYELERWVRDYLTVRVLFTQIQCFFSIVSTAFRAFPLFFSFRCLFCFFPLDSTGWSQTLNLLQIKNLAVEVQ